MIWGRGTLVTSVSIEAVCDPLRDNEILTKVAREQPVYTSCLILTAIY
jgi:hypothetical protein